MPDGQESHLQDHDEHFDDRSFITPTRLAALRPMLRSPTTYTQRLLERLDFVAEGGQSWRRDVQVLIPQMADLDDDENEWFVVSLGQFRRRRLPDFCVNDCSGRTLNLLTRVQHGHCLAYLTIDQFLYDPERDRIAEARSDQDGETLRTAFSRVYVPTFEMFTSVRADLPPIAEERLADLLKLLGTEDSEARSRAKIFMDDMTKVAEVTQYLCWVRARPGTPVRLTATYTMPDPVRRDTPDSGRGSGRLAQLRASARLWSTEVYAQLGLGPIFYGFRAPANDHAGSYYLTLAAPPETKIAYLDWGLENTIDFDGAEWACAHDSVHVHNGSGLLGPGEAPKPRKEIPDSKIHAFMRLDPADHKQVLFAALLNVIFVWLAEAGRLSSQLDSTTTPWLAVIPALLIAYVAQQRRHYFATSTRWIRGVIWGYLVLNIVFLVSITFDIAPDGSFADRHGVSDDAVSIMMAVASIVVFWIFAFIGWPYEPIVTRFFLRMRRRLEKAGGDVEDTVFTYLRVARWYGHAAVATIAVFLVAMGALILMGFGPHRSSGASLPGKSAKRDPGTGDSAHAGKPQTGKHNESQGGASTARHQNASLP